MRIMTNFAPESADPSPCEREGVYGGECCLFFSFQFLAAHKRVLRRMETQMYKLVITEG